MTITVWVEGREVPVATGQALEIGRFEGPGQIAVNDEAVSRRHGIIASTETGWTVEATGTQSGLVIYDHETPSCLHVPRGGGPIPIPFARSSVVIEVRQHRYPVTVHGPGGPGWTGAWASVLADTEMDRPSQAATRLPWDGVRWRDQRTGKPLRWYQALVAMCEPFFGTPPVEIVPSDNELATRLGTTAKVIQSRLIGEIRVNLGFDSYTPQLRQTMVSIAISQRLVTASDLSVLDVLDVGADQDDG